MADLNSTSSSSPSTPSIPSWAISFIVIALLGKPCRPSKGLCSLTLHPYPYDTILVRVVLATALFALAIFLAFVISNRMRPRRRWVDDVERQCSEMVRRSRGGVDGTDAASIITLVGAPPPVYAPKWSSPSPPLYRSTEDLVWRIEPTTIAVHCSQSQSLRTLQVGLLVLNKSRMADLNSTSSSSPSTPSIPSWAISFIVIALLGKPCRPSKGLCSLTLHPYPYDTILVRVVLATALFALAIFLAFVISNRMRPRRRWVDDVERQCSEMVRRSRGGVDGTDAASIITLVAAPPPVYAPKWSSPSPPLYRSTEDVSSVGRSEGSEDGLGRTVLPTQQA
ncbi:hypothetical protein PAXINDRAFT_16169 [Paxillus involutus ATCC 200175]|uniref:Unplaced genomic scaffold PAXINscaffold_71, whole genome shotgun sequence n=1 Tax=Paxillus involutus ATCC 200175 TaxID=664439 RepID=A0A0C9TSQ1_PAXIN|nr:hypothetical protein PAXINDRAFT_16169 [Paxillus involutus ATCC 200175]